ncbi:hypothetical protein AO381_1451 [Moraxella catarrhalis]|nr:hypothetical protein AO381_1451 [Moraxella catarrhalis]
MDKNISHCTPKLRFWEMVLNFIHCHGFISKACIFRKKYHT